MKVVNRIKNQPAKFAVSILLILAIVYLFFIRGAGNGKFENAATNKAKPATELSVFVQDGCYHCEQAEQFLKINKFENVNVVYYNLKDRSSQIELSRNVAKFKVPQNRIGTPIFS